MKLFLRGSIRVSAETLTLTNTAAMADAAPRRVLDVMGSDLANVEPLSVFETCLFCGRGVHLLRHRVSERWRVPWFSTPSRSGRERGPTGFFSPLR